MTYSGPWRVVNSLTTLRTQLDAAFPGRSHASDGTIADDAHSTTSDHYPHRYPALGATPVVTAFDGTHDPAHGCDSRAVAESIRLSRDVRTKYVISFGRMFSSYATPSRAAWAWGPYTGSSDPHTNHFHISVQPTALADSTAPWAIGVDDMALSPDEALMLAQVHAMLRASRWQWRVDRAAFLAAGGQAAVWDFQGGMGPNTAAQRLDELAAAVQAIHPSLSPADVAAIVQGVAPLVSTAVLDTLGAKLGQVFDETLEAKLTELLARVRLSAAPAE